MRLAVAIEVPGLNRGDWDLSWNMPLDGGGLLVSKDIRIQIEAEAVLQP
ncbi:MAG TPA: YceI family protein [Streptosporangiaceae bacterium]